jgi:hypothetical protein
MTKFDLVEHKSSDVGMKKVVVVIEYIRKSYFNIRTWWEDENGKRQPGKSFFVDAENAEHLLEALSKALGEV